MAISVKFFASLSEELGFTDTSVLSVSSVTIEDIWRDVVDRPRPKNLLCALNHEYAEFTQTVVDGDEVAFFPPVNGG